MESYSHVVRTRKELQSEKYYQPPENGGPGDFFKKSEFFLQKNRISEKTEKSEYSKKSLSHHLTGRLNRAKDMTLSLRHSIIYEMFTQNA